MPKKTARRALLSVSDKTGLIDFAKGLVKHHFEIISTGGTLAALKAAGVPALAVEKVTGFPEILEGRVKTLHPKIHGALLYRRDKKAHRAQAKRHGIGTIDLVAVNLYPFEKVTAAPKVELEEAIENIDIGGPSMLRSAAKNFDAVAVVCDPADYGRVLDDLSQHKGKVSHGLKKELALKVFQRTSDYDRAIASFLGSRNGNGTHAAEGTSALPGALDFHFVKGQDLRYGENPHQRAAWYGLLQTDLPFEQLHGKELSFNNLLDIQATLDVISEFSGPAACVVKHNNPCGIAEGADIAKALGLAVECDPLSAFGGIVGTNRPCDGAAARAACEALRFFEVFVAPSFTAEALGILRERKNLRIIAAGDLLREARASLDVRFLGMGGALVQDREKPLAGREAGLKKKLQWVTKTKLPDAELDDLIFAWKCAKVVKSNAIVFTQGRRTVGIGAGQMSRVDSVLIACRKAGAKTKGAYLASDAFFPMPDSIDAARDHGIRAIIQPGGSVKDAEVIAACDAAGIAMVFTGERHFRH